MIPERKQVTEEYPWIAPDAIRWLDQTLRPSWTVLETGMGGSTLFFAKRVARVISFENDPGYFDKTMRLVQRHGLRNVDGRYRAHYPTAGLEDVPEVDLAFIDGRGRVRSVIDAVLLVRPNGWLVLDDAERDRYEEAIRAADFYSSSRVDFEEGATRTSAWQIRRLPGSAAEEEMLS